MGEMIFFIVLLAAFCGVLFFIVKAAVAEGIKDAMWNLEVSMRNAVKDGTVEALQELEAKKSGTENKNG